MTTWNDVATSKNFVRVLDKGFIGLIDTMGSDAAIVQAARCSYGAGTKSVREDRGLIRYLLRNLHCSPFEMCQIKMMVKCPIHVARQWMRHRTASINEYSGRYSVMPDEFYVPEPDDLMPQSSVNKQGRAGELDKLTKNEITDYLLQTYEASYHAYEALLGTDEARQQWSHDCLPNGEDHPFGKPEYPGLTRELSRLVLPVANYTEFYWSINLRNFLQFLKLRIDDHAQHEIRLYSKAMCDLVQPLFPHTFEAAHDYLFEAHTMSRMAIWLLRDVARHGWQSVRECHATDKEMAEAYEMTVRELSEVVALLAA